jgi:hypothetical protein
MRRDEVHGKGAGREKAEEGKEDKEDQEGQERRERKEEKTRDKKEQLTQNSRKPTEHGLYPAHDELSPTGHEL